MTTFDCACTIMLQGMLSALPCACLCLRIIVQRSGERLLAASDCGVAQPQPRTIIPPPLWLPHMGRGGPASALAHATGVACGIHAVQPERQGACWLLRPDPGPTSLSSQYDPRRFPTPLAETVNTKTLVMAPPPHTHWHAARASAAALHPCGHHTEMPPRLAGSPTAHVFGDARGARLVAGPCAAMTARL